MARMFSFSLATGREFGGRTDLTVGQEPHTAVTVDVDNDGHLDLAVQQDRRSRLGALGDGHGNFTLSSTTSVLSPNP
jgi:hypothetical protein